MAWDIETARVRIGLAADDTSKDGELTAAMNAALMFAEKYCSRKFLFQEDTAEFIHFTNDDVQLSRYPIVAVNSVDRDGSAITNYHINGALGRLIFDSRVTAHVLNVSYSGGYEVLPADLEMALWRLFDTCWAILGATGGVSVGGGAVKAISSAGARIEFDTNSSSAASASGSNGISDPFAESILNLYRLETC